MRTFLFAAIGFTMKVMFLAAGIAYGDMIKSSTGGWNVLLWTYVFTVVYQLCFPVRVDQE